MNIEGVAYASLISESSIIIFIIIFLINDRGFLNKRIFKESVSSFTSLKDKLLVNGNMFIRSVILMTCFAHFMSLSADYGEIVLAANTILLNFFFIFSYGIDAFAHASEVMVGNSVGEKNVQKYDYVVRSSFKFTLLIAIIFLSIFIIFSSNIFSLITSHIDVIQKAEQNFLFLSISHNFRLYCFLYRRHINRRSSTSAYEKYYDYFRASLFFQHQCFTFRYRLLYMVSIYPFFHDSQYSSLSISQPYSKSII
jgi:MATE family multidrug resistance protein